MVHIPYWCYFLPAVCIAPVGAASVKSALLFAEHFTLLGVGPRVVVTTFARSRGVKPFWIVGDDVISPERSPTPPHYPESFRIHDAAVDQRIHFRTHG